MIIALRKRNKPRHTQKGALYEYIRRRRARTTMVFAGPIVLLIGWYSSLPLGKDGRHAGRLCEADRLGTKLSRLPNTRLSAGRDSGRGRRRNSPPFTPRGEYARRLEREGRKEEGGGPRGRIFLIYDTIAFLHGRAIRFVEYR